MGVGCFQMRRFILVITALALSTGCENETAGLVPSGPCESPNAIQSAASAAASAATATELLEAMNADLGTIASSALEANALQTAVFPDLGAIEPTSGSSLTWISTGVAGAGTPRSL